MEEKMVDKNNQSEYIKYLEDRIKKLSENSTIGDQDLDTLIDTQNEIILNNSYNFKQALTKSDDLAHQVATLQKRNELSDEFIQYLMNSFWWKATHPFRLVSRHIKNRQCQPFDFSHPVTIEDKVKVVVYINDSSSSLEQLFGSLRRQGYFKNLSLAVIDLTNSNDVAKTAKSSDVAYINLLATDNDASLAKKFISEDTKYVVYINQNLSIKSPDWLYKMIRPLATNYASASILYDEKSSGIKQIKKETYFKELKARIFKIEHYECMLLPTSRDKIQYIPPIVMNDVVAIAKKH